MAIQAFFISGQPVMEIQAFLDPLESLLVSKDDNSSRSIGRIFPVLFCFSFLDISTLLKTVVYIKGYSNLKASVSRYSHVLL